MCARQTRKRDALITFLVIPQKQKNQLSIYKYDPFLFQRLFSLLSHSFSLLNSYLKMMESIINSTNCFITEFYPRLLFCNDNSKNFSSHYQQQQIQPQQQQQKNCAKNNDFNGSLSMIAREKVNINRRSSQSVLPMETILEEEIEEENFPSSGSYNSFF